MKILLTFFAAFFLNMQILAADAKEPELPQLFLGAAFDVQGPLVQANIFKSLLDIGSLHFPRDTSFPLEHLGVQYVPKNVDKDKHLSIMMLASLVAFSNYLDKFGEEEAQIKLKHADKNFTMAGNGFRDQFSNGQLQRFLERMAIPYKQPGHTIIEGSNIEFIKMGQRTLALVGENSVFLTFAAMQLDNLWDKEEIDQLLPQVVDDYSLSETARNLQEYSVYETRYIATFLLMMAQGDKAVATKMNEYEKSVYAQDARLISAKLLWCQNQIARELGLARKDVVIIPQRIFQLGGDLFTTLKGAVVLRAPTPNNAYEQTVFAQQKLILEAHLPGLLIEAQESDPYLFDGVNIPNLDGFLYVGSDDQEINVRFENFLIKTCGYSAAKASRNERAVFEEIGSGIRGKIQSFISPAKIVDKAK